MGAWRKTESVALDWTTRNTAQGHGPSGMSPRSKNYAVALKRLRNPLIRGCLRSVLYCGFALKSGKWSAFCNYV